MNQPLKIGIAGLGTVGAGVVKLLAEHGRRLRTGKHEVWAIAGTTVAIPCSMGDHARGWLNKRAEIRRLLVNPRAAR